MKVLLKDPYETALRLMCFLSVTQNGLSSTDYRTLVTQFRQVCLFCCCCSSFYDRNIYSGSYSTLNGGSGLFTSCIKDGGSVSNKTIKIKSCCSIL